MRPRHIATLSTAALLMAGAAALGQETVAPSPDTAGTPRGENVSGYNIVDSFETGYRFATVGGDRGKYRSDVNYGNGIRLLSSSLTVNSRDGHGRWFDEIVLTTEGLGNDPYQIARLRVQKNALYRYDFIWRQNDFFDPALTLAGGEHMIDTTRRLQDHDLTLFPQSNFKFFLGYSRNTQSGPALTTEQLFDSRGNEFPLFSDVRRQQNDYRVGSELKLFGIRLNWMHGWEDFKDDTPTGATGLSLGNNPSSGVTLTSLTRREPYHGSSPYWRVALFNEGEKWYAVNGRFTYTAGRRAFVQDEMDLGANRFLQTQNRQVFTYGDADRPAATGNLTFSLFPSSWLTVTNHTSFYSIRIVGNSFFEQVDNSTLSSELVNFQYLGIRTIANATDLDFHVNRWLGFFSGYRYSDRRIQSNQTVTAFGETFPALAGQTNRMHEGQFGARLKPVRGLAITLDGEIGHADRPLDPVSGRNYHDLGARVQYKLKSFTLTAISRADYNVNSVSLSTYSAHSRTYSVNGSWALREWLALDAGYSKLHLDTVGGIAYFADAQLVTGDQSFYISNVHAANLGARIAFKKRADLYLGYNRVQDTGDGRANPYGAQVGSAIPAFQA
ncbi:MAG: hypothetical protein ABI165_04685, partial [Bryobacteraceae bacterium]